MSRIRVSARVQRALELYGLVHVRRTGHEDEVAVQSAELERLLKSMTRAETDAYYQGVAIRRRVTP